MNQWGKERKKGKLVHSKETLTQTLQLGEHRIVDGPLESPATAFQRSMEGNDFKCFFFCAQQLFQARLKEIKVEQTET